MTVEFTYLKQPLNRYTFKSEKIKRWVEKNCWGNVLNLFAGKTKLNVDETRVDKDKNMNADYYMDALDFVKMMSEKNKKFDTIILDPPYSYRKSMEKYNGNIASPFRQLKDAILDILNDDARVITFGYHSNSMGKIRGFKLEKICLICHGGAQHDTIAIVEKKIPMTKMEDFE